VGLTHLWVCLGFASERFKNAEPDEVAMTPFRYMRLVLIGLLTAMVLLPTSGIAAGCKLSTGIGQLALIERNIQSLEKALTGPDRQKIITGLRSKVVALKRRGGGFPAKARPVSMACNALAPFYAKVKAAKQKRDATLKKLRATRKAAGAKLDRARARVTSARGGLCPSKVPKEQLSSCHAKSNAFNQTLVAPFNVQAAQYRKLKKQLYAQIKAAKATYTKMQKQSVQRWKAVQRDAKKYKSARKAWFKDVKKVWGETANLMGKARRAKTAAKKARGGELGKLSGPLAKGKPGRSPGSKKIPGAITAKEGGAMGQAKAAKSSSDAGTAFGAGRVFDRGDVRYPKGKSGSGGVVDGRGMKPRAVPEKVRNSAGWQKLDRRQKTHQASRKKAQKKIDAIKKKLQSGKGNSGQLQVDLVRARDAKDRAQSKINVVKAKKDSFSLTLEEKPTPKVAPPKPVK